MQLICLLYLCFFIPLSFHMYIITHQRHIYNIMQYVLFHSCAYNVSLHVVCEDDDSGMKMVVDNVVEMVNMDQSEDGV